MPPFLTAAFYKFVALSDCDAIQPPLLRECQARQVTGTILLASEGINGTIAGAPDDVQAVLAFLRSDPRLADLEHKSAPSDVQPFHRMKVRLKREIVTLGVEGVDPSAMAGSYVEPRDWNALIAEPDVVVIDVRNDYEVALGSFERAIDPSTRAFSELPAWIERQRASGGVLHGKPRVAMFCTGGIRCEKSTAYLRSQGIDEVYHLKGGILKYLEQVPRAQSLWSGECFVFDERVAVGHGLAPGSAVLCRGCRRPVSARERALPGFRDGISCAKCDGATSESQKIGFAERQRQMALAESRGIAHLGAQAVFAAKAPRLPAHGAHVPEPQTTNERT
ncbi:MAG: rhodanese-related sulfurtransferase [Burkholderiales bacterium]